MKSQRKLWRNEEWFNFSETVKRRDSYKCLQCERSSHEVTLQVHHERYVPNKPPWEYAASDCRTLCKGCHAREHGLIEPDRGWSLISIDDLGTTSGACERSGCGSSIRYEHLTYHPSWGYKIVGSTCIEHLTQEDKLLSGVVLKLYKTISDFVHSSDWSIGFTKNSNKYISTKHNHHLIRIYGKSNYYSFQLAIKVKGEKWHMYKDIVNLKGKSFEEVKELAYIALKGTTTNDREEKQHLRKLYSCLQQKT